MTYFATYDVLLTKGLTLDCCQIQSSYVYTEYSIRKLLLFTVLHLNL